MRHEGVNHNPADDDEVLLSRVAWYYYHDGLTQHEVGRRLGLSRIKVSRLLERGKRAGIISFTIHSGFNGCLELESRLRREYGLQEAIVVPPRQGEPVVGVDERLARAAASYLIRFLGSGSLLAIGWGDMVTRVLSRVGHLLGDTGASVVSLTGGVGTYIQVIGGLSAALAHAQRLFMIPAPLVVSSEHTAQALKREPDVEEILDLARAADIALVGIGAVDAEASFVRGGYVSRAEMLRYERQGAVGDVLGQFFDRDGNVLDLDIHRRIVGVDVRTLGDIPRVIGVAGGPKKVGAIRSAILGGYLDNLITDTETAKAVLGQGR